MLYYITVVIIQKRFRGRFALLYSFISAGSSIGKMVLPPFVGFLNDTYGWRGALLIEAAIVFHCVAAVCYFKENEGISDRKTKPNNHKIINRTEDVVHKGQTDACDVKENEQMTCKDPNTLIVENKLNTVADCYSDDKSISKEPRTKCTRFVPPLRVWIITFVYLFQLVGTTTVKVFGVAKAEEDGANPLKASLVLAIIGVGGLFGRILNGVVIDRGWLSPIGVEIVMSTFFCVVSLIGCVVDGYAVLMTNAVCLGFTMAFLHTDVSIVLKEFDKASKFPINLGFVTSTCAFGDIGAGILIGEFSKTVKTKNKLVRRRRTKWEEERVRR